LQQREADLTTSQLLSEVGRPHHAHLRLSANVDPRSGRCGRHSKHGSYRAAKSSPELVAVSEHLTEAKTELADRVLGGQALDLDHRDAASALVSEVVSRPFGVAGKAWLKTKSFNRLGQRVNKQLMSPRLTITFVWVPRKRSGSAAR
jgi:hypothetical protein